MEQINEFLALKRQVDNLLDKIDHINKLYQIDNKRVALAKNKVNESFNILSKQPIEVPGKLPTHEVDRILNMVYDMSRGQREIFILLRLSDGSGIYDPLTGKTFKYE